MRILLITSLLLAACSFRGGSAASDGHPIDGPPDSHDGKLGSPDTPDSQACFGSGGLTVCLLALPQGGVTLPTTIATGSSSLDCTLTTQPAGWTAASQPDACFIVATTIAMPSQGVRVTGDRPLVLVATDSITVDASLDAASHRVIGRGPASPSGVCKAFLGNPGTSANGGGGGAGGSFTTIAGDGGKADNNNQVGGGAAGDDGVAPTILRGGCDGQTGGDGTGGGGLPGSGGGALYLVAGNTITITATGVLNASGGGGNGGGVTSGGGGGGAGGMIALFAPMITTDVGAVVMANGGSGASGGVAGMATGNNGQNGSDPDPIVPLIGAPGPVGPGGNGGTGFAQGTSASAGGAGDSDQGGGGGGGAAGYIQANVALTNAIVTPTAD